MAHRGKSQLEQVIGAEGVRILSEHFSGQRIYIPSTKAAAIHRFVANYSPLIGADKAFQLVDQLGGFLLPIPTLQGAGGYHPRLDVGEVMEFTRDGLSARQIAKIMKCEPRAVYRARRRAKNPDLVQKKKRLKRGKRKK